jgi:hypothetical protein
MLCIVTTCCKIQIHQVTTHGGIWIRYGRSTLERLSNQVHAKAQCSIHSFMLHLHGSSLIPPHTSRTPSDAHTFNTATVSPERLSGGCGGQIPYWCCWQSCCKCRLCLSRLCIEESPKAWHPNGRPEVSGQTAANRCNLGGIYPPVKSLELLMSHHGAVR